MAVDSTVPADQLVSVSREPRHADEIDVVIVTYGSASTISACISAVLAVGSVGRVVVVDHGSDDSPDIAKSLGAVVFRDPSNPGFGAGQNRGLKMTTAESVLLLNPDAIVEPTALEVGVRILATDPEVAAVEGVIIESDSGNPERSAGRRLSPIHLWGRALGLKRLLRFGVVRRLSRRVPALSDHVERAPDSNRDVESLSATALLIRRKALEQVGGFDERFFMYGEDADLSLRLRRAGWKLTGLPMIWAHHTAGASSPESFEHELIWWQGAMTFAALWYGPFDWVLALGACKVRCLGLSLRRPTETVRVFETVLFGALKVRKSSRRVG